MNNFHKAHEYKICQCTVCYEAWLLKLNSKLNKLTTYQCSRCSGEKDLPKKISKENDMVPSAVPNELSGLTQVEEMLIARALPIIHIYLKQGGQRGYSGHCVNFPQNVGELAKSLPRYPKDLSVIVVKIKGKENTFKTLNVRRQVVADALFWLLKHNPHYSDVELNQDALNSLPNNSIPDDLLSVETQDTANLSDELNYTPDRGPSTVDEEDVVFSRNTDTSCVLPVPNAEQQEIEFIQQQVQAQTNWPSVKNSPLNEYTTSFLATMAFLTLFPDGKGDPTNPSLHKHVTLSEKINHLCKFAENKYGLWHYRFAQHPRFSNWALNMIQRAQILQQSGIFLKQNPGEQHLTIDELREMVVNNSSNVFMAKLSRHISNLSGSNAYWHKVKEDLKATIQHVRPPTFFFTFSSADMHWPELHALLVGSDQQMVTSISSDTRRQNVINNPHIVDWFFTQCLQNFTKYWLYDSLDAEWHWYRFEYQSRGSIHCHSVAKLKNDPGLCRLSEIALKGHLEKGSKDEDIAIVKHGPVAEATICKSVDWLLSTYNPNNPEENNWIKPVIHPCKKKHVDANITDTDYEDFSILFKDILIAVLHIV